MTAIVSAIHDDVAIRPWRGRMLPYCLLTPAVLATLIVVFLPMLEAIVTSLYDFILWKPNASRFVGLGNYLKLLRDPVFWISAGHTAVWIGLTVPLQMGIGLVAALLLNRQFPWRGLARALVVIPWALPSVVIALVWRWIYDPNTGILNELLLRLHIIELAVPWLADPDKAHYAVIATLTWQGFPFFAVMILAGLQSIPESQYEAAATDGADAWQRFRHVTLPGISGILATAGLLPHHLGRQFGRRDLRHDRRRPRLCDLHLAALCLRQGATESRFRLRHRHRGDVLAAPCGCRRALHRAQLEH